MLEVRTVFLSKEGQGYQFQHKQQAQLPPPISKTRLFINSPFKAEQNLMLSLPSCRFASCKDQILVLPEGHNFKIGRRGTHPHLAHPQALWPWVPHLLQLHWDKAQQKDNRTRPCKMWGMSLARPKFRTFRDLYHVKNGDFLSCQGDTASKCSVAAQQDETNTAGTWERLIQGVILAGRQAKMWRQCVYGVKKISSSFSWSIKL